MAEYDYQMCIRDRDIDDATIVYFSCKIHNAGILSAYNYLNGTNVSSTEKKWTLGDNEMCIRDRENSGRGI